MTVCQFFLEGRCRFGQNCRNEHSFSNVSDDRNNRGSANTQQLKNIIRQIVCEVMIAEKGGQWPLSCFAPVKEGPNIPGWEDISPEEMRWKMYEARRNGTLNQCINQVNQLYSEAEKRRNALKQPTMKEIGVIVNVLKGKKESTTISNPFGSSVNTNNTIFGGSPSPTSGSPNIFGGTPTSGSIFGGSPPTPASQANIFGGNTSGFGNQSIFGGMSMSETINQNIFSTAQSPSQNIFSQSSSISLPEQNIFSNSQSVLGGGNVTSNFSSLPSPSAPPIFAAQSMLFQPAEKSNQPQPSIFGGSQTDIFKSQNSFGGGNENFTFDKTKAAPFGGQVETNFSARSVESNQQSVVDHSVYSKKEDLTSDELEAFGAATFRFGKIPSRPPPLECCK